MTEFLAVLSGIFTFWNQVVWFVKLLQKTPEEQHDALIKQVNQIFDEAENNGRPQW